MKGLCAAVCLIINLHSLLSCRFSFLQQLFADFSRVNVLVTQQSPVVLEEKNDGGEDGPSPNVTLKSVLHLEDVAECNSSFDLQSATLSPLYSSSPPASRLKS